MVSIELRSTNVPISVALREHVTRRLEFVMRRFSQRVRRVVVRIVDVNGPKGGPDKRCRIIARLEPSRSVSVEATDSDAYAAVSQAALRLDERVARVLAKGRARVVPLKRIAPAAPVELVPVEDGDESTPA